MVLTNCSITTWHIYEKEKKKNKTNFEAMPGGRRHQSPLPGAQNNTYQMCSSTHSHKFTG